MKKSLLLFFSIIILSDLSACSCAIPPATFCESITQLETWGNPYFVVKGIVTKQEDDGMEVTVQNVLSGNITEEKMFFRTGNGASCIHYTSGFSKDESYIFVTGEKYNGGYGLNICYISFLEIDGNIVKGPIAPGIESIAFTELSTLGTCSEKLSLFSVNNSLAVFPNPTFNEIRIKNISEYESRTILQLEIIDAIGRSIRFYKKEDGFLIGEEWIVNASELAAGVYILRIISGGDQEVIKIVKQ